MIIQCPSCKSRAKLPDSKEGAKVRCPQCERVYVARPRGAGASTKGPDPTKWFLVGGVALALVALFFAVRDRGEDAPVVAAEPEPPPPPVEVDTGGWNSPAVRVACSVHEHAAAAAEVQLADVLAADRAWELRSAEREADAEEAGQDDPLEESTPRTPADGRPWDELSMTERAEFTDALVAELEGDLPGDVVADWEPFDGKVLRQSDEESTVRLTLSSRSDPSVANRHVDWTLVRREGTWKACAWERWFSDQELAALRAARAKKTTSRTLSDGSFVIEGAIRPIEFLPETSEEERARIDALCTELIDLEARPGVRIEAHDALVEIGKPAIPALLTQLATIPLETEEQAIQLNLVHEALTEITGYPTSFSPHEALGATEERQESGLKQWFGWYDRKFERFQQRAEEEDPFGDLAPRNEKERREFEKIRRESEDG